MIRLFKIGGRKQEKLRIIAAFPVKFKSEVDVVLNIVPFCENDIKLIDGKIHKLDNLISSDIFTVQLENELLTIPHRVYFNEPKIEKENGLSPIQKTILNCIYLLHHNGYVRQSRLEKLLDSTEYISVPFCMQLLGEYVFEILKVLNEHISERNIPIYRKFIKENPKYWQQTESRMISYWNEYYRRRFPKLNEYTGQQIVKRIKTSQ